MKVTVYEAAKNAEISYAETVVEKTYGDEDFINPLTNSGDGTVTYAANPSGIITIDKTTGKVSILKADTTTITATAANGTISTYASAVKTAKYTLTVNKAEGWNASGQSGVPSHLSQSQEAL